MTNLETNRPGTDAAESTFEQRWAAWLARGQARDKRSGLRLNAVRGVVLVALVGWLLWGSLLA
jgi:hypothetical protein